MKKINISFIIPARDEQESVEVLYKELLQVMGSIKKSYEIIFIDDGSSDLTFKTLKKIHTKDKKVRVFRLRGNFGKAIALQVGFENARADTIITLDADLQDDPREIPNFLKELNKGYDLVSGWKKKRYDPASKVIPSRIFNYLVSILTGVKIHDINCGFKAYRRQAIENINIYGELYRFIPIFSAKQNFKVTEIVIKHRKRMFGKTKFGWERNIKGLLDLITIVFLTGYFRRPGHFFGTIGLISLLCGTIIGAYISFLRFSTGSIQYRHPLLFLGMLLIIIGIQLISTGLLAEMNIYNREKSRYDWVVKEKLGKK